MRGRSSLDEGPVEKVAVVGDEDVRANIEDVVEEPLKRRQLVGLVEHSEIALKFGPGEIQ